MPQHRLDRLGVDPRRHLAHPQPDMLLRTTAALFRERGVDTHETQVLVVHREPDRGLGEKAVQHGQVRLHPTRTLCVESRGDHQRRDARTGDQHESQPQFHQMPTAMPQAHQPGPLFAGQHLVGQGPSLQALLSGHQQVPGVAPHRLGRGVAEQRPGVRTPVQDAPVGLKHGGSSEKGLAPGRRTRTVRRGCMLGHE
jgi:hypothetical protein